ncbi:hypothetical protein GDO81_007129 [Engystomops pustulosus]|uniref:Uncharacterized protein n=1 Tax=Engystomops pustulosus TaxID=76066 RepID=A0AAV7C515_ENGPU|nr:hypothetical protein GDO81_007129 [Engystomops pustulosus]
MESKGLVPSHLDRRAFAYKWETRDYTYINKGKEFLCLFQLQSFVSGSESQLNDLNSANLFSQVTSSFRNEEPGQHILPRNCVSTGYNVLCSILSEGGRPIFSKKITFIGRIFFFKAQPDAASYIISP